ncbi:putative oxidoreductase [Aspergillus heteromorphus CBS 117.55]|uniref:D-xylose 1-dehydrogenase (NADP(+), D-xylono-1,5-lactone-forming) n=1 Tax=Aspergillus heteromorphus CBS 117.55 TaxID=1448321 RepID=A0A317VIV3_9EURO|nr:putative oxidoreductase [Aspergillus heteromorphus CBS 117.55]PWY74273.1 putative oxidoreductase [Aspergillus heteromorphus CBS 117.55]
MVKSTTLDSSLSPPCCLDALFSQLPQNLVVVRADPTPDIISAPPASSWSGGESSVRSPRSLDTAQAFLRAIDAPATTRAYGTYDALLADPAVDIVYIASPHSHHFAHAHQALTAHKHVLLEKAFTVNTAQAQLLVQLARARGRFLMEALTQQVQQLVRDGAIGTVQRIVADRNLGRDIETLFRTCRLVNPALAGGALLDCKNPLDPQVASSVIRYPATGVEETVTVVITAPEAKIQGVATASLRVRADPSEPGVRILGTHGQIQVFGPAARPDWIQVVEYASTQAPAVTRFLIPQGHGLFWEADECARCVRDGRLESDVMPLAETLAMMSVLDQVRAQNGLRFPPELESIAA